MACVEEWKAKLSELGLSPLPPHLDAFIVAMCAGDPTSAMVDFLFRLYSWPKRLLELTQIYEISDEDFKRLQDLYLSTGDSRNFAQAVSSLPSKRGGASSLANSLQDSAARIESLNQKLRGRRAITFDTLEEEERQGRGADAPPISLQELDRLRQLFVASTMSTEQLRDLLSRAAAKQFKP